MLASEYNWSKKEIFEETFIDELIKLLPVIKRRRLAEHKMQLTLIQNPHVKDPQALWKLFDEQERELNPHAYLENEKLDRQGMERLRSMMSNGGGFIVK